MPQRQIYFIWPAANNCDVGKHNMDKNKFKSDLGWSIWIDRGGTFTDIIGQTPNGKILTHKLLSDSSGKYGDAVVQGIRDLLRIGSNQPIPASMIKVIKMGTTVATNALLERKGERTLLVTTRGFKDALRIAYQNRPKLFDQHIVLETLLYERVAEISERLSAQGDIINPLREPEVKKALGDAYSCGIRSVAIVLMHAYKYPKHEHQIAAIAKNIGFTQISTSHETSPLIKFIARGDTTVLDAYLSPILRTYIDNVLNQLNFDSITGPRLMFMQSNGGLTESKFFQGKNSILSGPAGGVVGMAKTAQLEGFTKIIGFDMGGTSTDVSHFNGKFERTSENIISGIRMRTPMMKVHTVAAGGGSILHFDGARFRIGPDSAGASPGPSCYRRGGPLTVTDCNVIIGKLQPTFFPAVFGNSGDKLLDTDIVKKNFLELAEKISSKTDEPAKKIEEIAEGFLRVANENMANAIKKISVQRGYNVTEYTLNCFGGAAGQHACQVADLLGIEKVFFHPFAGVLSAFGIGLADVTEIREKTLSIPLESNLNLKNYFGSLEAEAKSAITIQGFSSKSISTDFKVHIRYEGTDSALIVPFTKTIKMIKHFENLHLQHFGFVSPKQKLIIETLSVEVTGFSNNLVSHANTNEEAKLAAPVPTQIFCEGSWHNATILRRQHLAKNTFTYGPAIIADKTGTIIVEPGWRAQITNRNSIIITRYIPRPKFESVRTKVDPVMLEIFNNLFMSIAEQMGATLENTAYSINIKERLDFSCALFDQNGNLIANAPHMPVHLGSMGESIRAVISQNKGKLRPGNVYASNAPYNGGTHLPDITIITPVFDTQGEKLLFFVGSRGHHADIGGITPGSMPPNSQTVEQEGVLIDNFLLVENNIFQEKAIVTLLTSAKYPVRNISQNLADLRAQVAANETGVAELRRIVRQFGLITVHSYMKHVQDNAKSAVQNALILLNGGKFKYLMDTGSQISVKISVNKKHRTATIDFTGTSCESPDNFNAPSAICKAAVLYVFRTLVDDDIPLNSGCLEPLKIIVPKNCLLNPSYPAAVVAGNVETSQCITDAIYGALGILASAQGTMNNLTFGNEHFQYYETICGGSGAGPNFNGTDAVQTHMTNSRLTDPEILENLAPVRVESFEIRTGSGGDGYHSGGAGTIRKLYFLEQMTVAILSLNRINSPHGLNGGSPGKRGRNWVKKSDGSIVNLKGTDQTILDNGDTIIIETPGGGGFGKVIEK